MDSKTCGTLCSSSGNLMRMNIIFNPHVIQFSDRYEEKGVDIAAYDGSGNFDA